MPSKPFKVGIFDVVAEDDDGVAPTPFHRAIQHACDEDIDGRYISINGRGFRLEHDRRRNRRYYLNFIRTEYDGPGRVQRNTPVRPIGLQSDE